MKGIILYYKELKGIINNPEDYPEQICSNCLAFCKNRLIHKFGWESAAALSFHIPCYGYPPEIIRGLIRPGDNLPGCPAPAFDERRKSSYFSRMGLYTEV